MNKYHTKLRMILQALGIAAFFIIPGLLFYANTLDAPFVFDDQPNIVENPYIRMTRLSPEQILRIKDGPSASRLPAMLTFALNYYFHQYRPPGYHLINILIHIINALLVFGVARQTLRLCRVKSVFPTSLLIALLWLSHPLHTQSVTYVVQRMNSMAALFYLLALLCYVEARRIPRSNNHALLKKSSLFTAVVLSGVLGLGSKETIATLPIMLFFYEWFFFQKISTAWLKKKARQVGFPLIIFLTIVLLYVCPHLFGVNQSLYDTQNFTLSQRVLTEPSVIIYYISLLIFPHPSRLNLDYDFPLSTGLFSPPGTIFSLLTIFALLATAIYSARRHRLAAFAILWFLITLSIESSFIGLALIFEHRTYLPSVFPVIAVTVSAIQHIPRRRAVVTALLLVAGINGFWTWQRNTTWGNASSLWTDCIVKSPKESRGYSNLGVSDIGDPKQAITFFQKALELNPTDPAVIYTNLGRAYTNLGEPEKAVPYLKSAIQIDPTLQIAYVGLGAALAQSGRPEEAIPYYETVLATGTPTEEVYILMGAAQQQAGHIDEALKYFHLALKIAPHSQAAHNHIGLAYTESGQPVKALSSFSAAIAIGPAYQPAYINMGTALLKANQPGRALVYYQKAFALGPVTQDACVNMGTALEKTGQIDKAIQYYNQALDSGPHCMAYNNLGKVYFEKGDIIKAQLFFQKALQVDPAYHVARENLDKLQNIIKNNRQIIEKLEDQLQSQPFNTDLLYQLGNLYAATGQYDQAAGTYESLALLLPSNSTVYYNLACIYARQNQIEKAIENLRKAVNRGYNNWSRLKEDDDLENIKNTPYFQRLINSLNASQPDTDQ